MAKMRDKIAHFYFGVDHELVWGVATVELPAIRPDIETVIREIEADS